MLILTLRTKIKSSLICLFIYFYFLNCIVKNELQKKKKIKRRIYIIFLPKHVWIENILAWYIFYYFLHAFYNYKTPSYHWKWCLKQLWKLSEIVKVLGSVQYCTRLWIYKGIDVLQENVHVHTQTQIDLKDKSRLPKSCRLSD